MQRESEKEVNARLKENSLFDLDRANKTFELDTDKQDMAIQLIIDYKYWKGRLDMMDVFQHYGGYRQGALENIARLTKEMKALYGK